MTTVPSSTYPAASSEAPATAAAPPSATTETPELTQKQTQDQKEKPKKRGTFLSRKKEADQHTIETEADEADKAKSTPRRMTSFLPKRKKETSAAAPAEETAKKEKKRGILTPRRHKEKRTGAGAGAGAPAAEAVAEVPADQDVGKPAEAVMADGVCPSGDLQESAAASLDIPAEEPVTAPAQQPAIQAPSVEAGGESVSVPAEQPAIQTGAEEATLGAPAEPPLEEQPQPLNPPQQMDTDPAPTPEQMDSDPAPTPEQMDSDPAPTPEQMDTDPAPTPEQMDADPAPTPVHGVKDASQPAAEGEHAEMGSQPPTPTTTTQKPQVSLEQASYYDQLTTSMSGLYTYLSQLDMSTYLMPQPTQKGIPAPDAAQPSADTTPPAKVVMAATATGSVAVTISAAVVGTAQHPGKLDQGIVEKVQVHGLPTGRDIAAGQPLLSAAA